jgi:FHA domain
LTNVGPPRPPEPRRRARDPAAGFLLLIGHRPACDVRIDPPKNSRRHGCLALAYDRLQIRDLGSRNGMRVNGLVVEEARLNPGDEVAIGPLIDRMEDLSSPPASSLVAGALATASALSNLLNLPADPGDPVGELVPLLDL